MIRGIVIGIVLTLAVLALAGYVGVRAGLMPANADSKPWPMERWAARTSLHATVSRDAPKGDNPVPSTDANLTEGIKLYAANCAVCHGSSDAKASNIAHGLYVRAPQLAEDGVEDDPAGVTYWKIAHGIRFTGMPAFGAALDEHQIWLVTLFLQHMDGLPPAPKRVWKAVPSSATAKV